MMRFDRLHRGVSALTVLIGFAVLYLSGEFSTAIMGGACAALFTGPFVHRFFVRRSASISTNVVVVLTGIVAGYQAFATGNFLYYTILYAVFLGAVKSLMLRRGGDFMQLYALSFLHVVAGAVINPGLSFGVAMFPYVVCLTLSLMLTNLRRGIEDNLGADHDPTGERVELNLARKDLIRPGFLTVTVGITAAVFLISLVFFFLFPRMGLGFFATQSRFGIAMTGFSDTVTLGDFGNIIEDPEVVMRVKFDGRPTTTPLRMRGQSLDEYDGKSWRKTTRRLRGLNMDSKARYRVDNNEMRLDDLDPVVQEIYLEPMVGTPRVLFGLPNPVGFKRPSSSFAALRPTKWRFYMDDAHDVSVTGPPRSSIVYTVYSVQQSREPERMRSTERVYSDLINSIYNQLPATQPRIKALARRMAGDGAHPFDAAGAIERALKDEYQYALNSVHGEEDPLADFLFRNRQGHCEYFASAMVVLLRHIGIPSRIVNGFYGGEANEYGGYVYLRKADAHSWVEVWFPGVGWVTFDPTPPVALDLRMNRSWWRTVTDAVDNVKLWWYRWVVEYDLEQQVEFVAGLFRLLDRRDKGAFSESGLRWKDFKKLKHRLKALPWGKWALSVVAIVALLIGIRWLVLRRRRSSPAVLCRPQDPAVKAYRTMLKLLARRGLARKDSETQVEFLGRVVLQLPDAAHPARELTWAYLRAAYSSTGPAADAAETEATLQSLRQSLASGQTSP
ncbi:MAG: DUF3488 domain-containing protein [Deltaproteobacteria bacterium]|nr:DUF3488 domain-containing protein [Deltaproteobacteria bacterium]